MNAASLRVQYPVFDSVAFLDAGTCGPLPAAALRVNTAAALAAAEQGRATTYFEEAETVRARLRAAYAGVVGGRPEEIALTTSTSDGMARVLAGLGLQRGDEVLTADDEHPGLYGPLAAARAQLGIDVRAVPLAEIANEVTPRTRLVACSHVSWVSGALAPAELASLGEEVPVLLDGAQGAGAVPVDVSRLGCSFYAAAGQKWLCGPVGTGLLWVASAWRERLAATAPTYLNLSVPSDALDAKAWPDARAHDASAISVEALTAALTAHDVIATRGWSAVQERAVEGAAVLADRLRGSGRTVVPRGDSTLVSWDHASPDTAAAHLAAEGIVVRSLPQRPYLRASVGAWNNEDDFARLFKALRKL